MKKQKCWLCLMVKEPERIEWSASTGLVKVLSSFSEYPEDQFVTEFLITMRMRGYAMDKDSEITYPDGEKKTIHKEELQMHMLIGLGVKAKTGAFQPA